LRERERENTNEMRMSHGGKRGDPPIKTQLYLKIELIYTNKAHMHHVGDININDYNRRHNVESSCLSIRSKEGTL